MHYRIECLSPDGNGWVDAFSLDNQPMHAPANRWEQEGPALRLLSCLHDLWPTATLRVTRIWDDNDS